MYQPERFITADNRQKLCVVLDSIFQHLAGPTIDNVFGEHSCVVKISCSGGFFPLMVRSSRSSRGSPVLPRRPGARVNSRTDL